MRKNLILLSVAATTLCFGCGGAAEEPQSSTSNTATSELQSQASGTSLSINAIITGNYRSARSTPRSAQLIKEFQARHAFLSGTEIDGNWPVSDDGKLEPSVALKRRFDYLLLAVERESESELTTLLQTLADEELSPPNAILVKDLWGGYIELLKSETALVPDPKNQASIDAYLAHITETRIKRLGKDWAEAFFSEEDKSFRRTLTSN